MTNSEQNRSAVYGKIIARAWRDPAFKAKLVADPQVVLSQAGVALPAGVTVKVVENTDRHFHLVLPPKPADALSDEALDKVAAAWGDQPCAGVTYNWDGTPKR